MPATATTPATSRCGWPSRAAARRANWPQAIVAALPPVALLARAEVAGAGFINFHLAGERAERACCAQVLRARRALRRERRRPRRARAARIRLGQSDRPAACRPRPPGRLWRHARQSAARRSAISVHREYYINDAGRQMDILTRQHLAALPGALRRDAAVSRPTAIAATTCMRSPRSCMQQLRPRRCSARPPQVLGGLPPDAPAGRQGTVRRCADRAHARAARRERASQQVLELALAAMLADIRDDLAAFGVEFDRWYSERELVRSGAVEHALEALEARGALYRKDGAVWFRASQYGDDEDRVLVRANGQHDLLRTRHRLPPAEARARLRAPDRRARRRSSRLRRARARRAGGHGRAGRLPRGLPDPVRQPVSRRREDCRWASARAQFVTLRQLREEVGNDACRLFYLMRSHDQHAGFRSGAGQVAQQRESGLLHPVRACARRQRDAAARGARTAVRCSAGAAEPGAARQRRTSRRCCASWRAIRR